MFNQNATHQNNNSFQNNNLFNPQPNQQPNPQPNPQVNQQYQFNPQSNKQYNNGFQQNSGHAENSFGSKDNIEPVFNFSYTGGHALAFSLVKRSVPPQTSKADYKDKLFFFVTFAPGVGTGADRTYDYKNGRITQKFSVREVIGLIETMKQCCMGNDNNVLPYAKMTKQANVGKTLTVWMSTKQQTINNQNVTVRLLNISIFSGQIRYTLNLSIADALGLSEYLSKICQKAIDLEFELQNSGSSIRNPTRNIQNQNYMNVNQPQMMS